MVEGPAHPGPVTEPESRPRTSGGRGRGRHRVLAAAGAERRGDNILRASTIAIVCGAWEIAGRIPINYAFPSFSDTALALARLILDGSLPKAYVSTLQPLLLGIAISAGLGIALGVMTQLRRSLEWTSAGLHRAASAPVAALIPLITFVYGIGMTSKTLAVIVLALPVIVLNSYKAVRNVNPSLIAMARSFLASRWQQVRIVPPRRLAADLRGPPARHRRRLHRRGAGRAS